MGKFEYKITDENINDILVTAIEGGINYWCGKVEVKGNDYKGAKYASDAVSAGAVIILHDAEGIEDSVEIDKVKIVEAVERYIQENGTGIVDLDSGEIDCGQVDAEVADVIIQLAAFGEVVYG